MKVRKEQLRKRAEQYRGNCPRVRPILDLLAGALCGELAGTLSEVSGSAAEEEGLRQNHRVRAPKLPELRRIAGWKTLDETS